MKTGKTLWFTLVLALSLPMVPGCGDDDDDIGDSDGGAGDGGGGGDGGAMADAALSPGTTFRVTGSASDFKDGTALGSVAISINGITPAPTVTAQGATFTITGIPPFSVFHALASNAPNHRATYNAPITVNDADVSGVALKSFSETYLSGLQTAFALTPTAGTGILFVRATDMVGAPRAGILGTTFFINGAAAPRAPFFLDANLNAAPAATMTSASGYLVFYNVPPGLVTLSAASGTQAGVSGPIMPVAANTITVADWAVIAGAPPMPTNVLFATQVVPIFTRRGCETCHSGNGIGRDLGGLTLNGANQKIHGELTQELSPNYQAVRVNLAAPAMSKLLTLPSFESPPDRHPNATFGTTTDPDYQLILIWIREGARLN